MQICFWLGRDEVAQDRSQDAEAFIWSCNKKKNVRMMYCIIRLKELVFPFTHLHPYRTGQRTVHPGSYFFSAWIPGTWYVDIVVTTRYSG